MTEMEDLPSPSPLRCVELYGHQEAVNTKSSPLIPVRDVHGMDVLEFIDVVLIHAPALDALTWCSAHNVRPTMCYIDPPYASHRDYHIQLDHPTQEQKVKRVAFGDRWEGGIHEYVEHLRPILNGIHTVLEDEGGLLLHVDSRATPYLSICCDTIFGMGERLSTKNAPGFRNELIWKYGLGGSSPRAWPRKHDNILWYSCGSNWYFDPPMTPATSLKMKGQLKKHPDVIDIPSINNMARDRTGYPTQKPIELLQMLIQAHAKPNEWVMDVFGGSGTTALAAFQTKRRAILADRSDDAIAISRERLVAAGARVAVFRSASTPQANAENDPSARIWEAVGQCHEGTFVATSAAIATHRLVRSVYGHDTLIPVNAS